MNRTQIHVIVQSVILGISDFLRKQCSLQGSKIEMVHDCHVGKGRNDGSEELIYRTDAEQQKWVRIRIDMVDSEYTEAVKAAHAEQDAVEEKAPLNKDVATITIIHLNRLRGIKLR